jgi:hypothetical protein
MPGFNIGGGGGADEPSNTVEIHRANRWRILSLGDIAFGDERSTLLYAKSLVLPGFNVEEEIVEGGAVKYKFAKMVNWEDVSLEFYDVFGVFATLASWQSQVFTPETGIGLADEYKKNCTFVLTDGAGKPVDDEDNGFPFTLHGAWPKQISHSPLSYESSDLKLVSMILSYDYVTYDQP